MPADLKTLASMIVDVIQGSAPKTRAFFGHSMGAVVAYETARSIGSDGKPTALFVSGRRAPSSTRPDEDHMLDEQSLVNKVLSLGGTDVQALLDSDVRQMVMPVIRRDYQLVECYRHSAGPKLDLPIIGLVGEHDAMTTIDEADAWRNHTSGPFTLHRFPGGHFFLNEHPRAVADIISRSLNPGKDAAVNDMLGRGGSELLRGWLLAWPLYR
jgi:surfactin synthase thioesterase subunit